MKKIALAGFVAIMTIGAAFTLQAVAATGDAPPDMHRRMEVQALLLDAHLAGMKAALKLTPDQEKAWAPFEAAVRDAAKPHMEGMHTADEAGEHRSPIEHIEAMADRLGKASASLKKVADAAKPLFEALNETQKHDFGPLAHMLVEHGPHMHGMHHGERPGQSQ